MNQHNCTDAPEWLHDWRIRQEAERQRLQELDISHPGAPLPDPPSRPPKRPELGLKVEPPNLIKPVPFRSVHVRSSSLDSSSASASNDLEQLFPSCSDSKDIEGIENNSFRNSGLIRKPRAPDPPPSPPALPARTYHKDSYITQRRGECLGQEGRYRRTSSPSSSTNSFPNPFSSNSKGSATKNHSVAGLTAKEDFHRSLLQDDKVINGRDELSSIQQNDPRIGFASPEHDLSSVNSGWNDIEFVNDAHRNRHSSGSMPPTSTTSTIIFTSDALKKLRKSQLLPEPPQGLNQCPPPPDLNSLASKLTRPAPNFLASATTYSRKRQNNSFQKVAGSLSAKSCFNLLDPEGRNTPKRSLDHGISKNGSTYHINESTLLEENHRNHFVKKDSNNEEKSKGYMSWSKNRRLQPAKSTPSLLHINDDPITNAPDDLSSTREEMAKFNDVDYSPSNFTESSENNDTSLTSDEDVTLKRASIASNDLSPQVWKNSLESLLDNEAISNASQSSEGLNPRNKISSVDNLHLKPPTSSFASTDSRTPSSSKTSSLGSAKGHSSAFAVRQGRQSRMSSNASSTASSAPSSVDQPHVHSHSNSDSGLSSLTGGVGGGFGRTSTMSPVSTLSTLSSISSSSSVASSTSNASSMSGVSRPMNRKSSSTLSTSQQRSTCGQPKLSPNHPQIQSDVSFSEDVISMTSKKNSEARNEQIANKSAQCDPNQLPSVSEKGFNTNLMNRKTSTEYKEKKSPGEVRNVENEEEEEDDLGNNLDSGNGTMRVKAGNNRALRGLYNGWYEGSRTNGVVNKFQEEIECEQLSAEFVKRLSWHQPEKCNPRLQELFVPSPAHKTPSHYMEGILFGINQTSEGSNNPKPDENDESPPPPLPLRQPRVVRPPTVANAKKSLVSPSTLRRKIEELKSDNNNQCNTSSASHRAFSSTSANELLQNTDTTKTSRSNNEIRLPTNEKQFYNICQQQQPSLPEMKFHHLNNENIVGGPQIISSHSDFKGVKPNNIEEKHGLPRPPFVNGNEAHSRQDSLNGIPHNKDGIELQQKKEELLQRISRKLDVLRAEDMALKEEVTMNEELGRHVSSLVESSCTKQSECLKYRLHVEEIDKITSLLLGLSGRLARTENSIAAFESNTSNTTRDSLEMHEKKILENKRSKLMEQLDEAKRLKESIDRRSTMVSRFLQNYLSESDYADYEHFVKMKAKLIMDSREISDKIKLGEEQLQALKDSIVNSPSSKNKNSSSTVINYNATMGCDNNAFESKTTL